MRANERRLIREISKSARRFFSATSQKRSGRLLPASAGEGKRQREAVRSGSYATLRKGGNAAGLLGLELVRANRPLH
jgi:hypothetical protein